MGEGIPEMGGMCGGLSGKYRSVMGARCNGGGDTFRGGDVWWVGWEV